MSGGEGIQEIKDRFSAALRKRVLEVFGKRLSAEAFAHEFNCRPYVTRTIGRETARRLLRGVRLPTVEQLTVLTEWLGVDFSELIETTSSRKPQSFTSIPQPLPIHVPGVVRQGPRQDDVNLAAVQLAHENIDLLVRLLEESKKWIAR